VEAVIRDVDDIEKRILEAAEVEFAARGFHETVVSDIADQANVGKGTVYRHFGSKEQLFVLIVEAGIKELLERIKDAARNLSSAREKLEIVAEIHLNMFRSSRHLVKIITEEGFKTIMDSRSRPPRLVEELIDYGSSIISEGVKNGEFRSVDSFRTARLYLDQLFSITRTTILFNESDKSVSKDYQLFFEIFINGLSKDTI
jgi:TetR/AcrR family fatty acid metabolism transcriptional regulator